MFRTGGSLALVASGLIALSACTGGHPAAGRSAVTATSSTPATQAASTAAGPAGVTAGSVRIGPVTEEFATALPADTAQARVIEGWRASQVYWEQSVQAWRVVASASAYVTGNALKTLHSAVATDVAYHVILTGTNRLYRTSVTSLTADGATVSSCDDGSKVIDENPSTGKKYQNQAGAVLTFFVIWQLVPAAGHWAITSYTLVPAPDPRERVCAGD